MADPKSDAESAAELNEERYKVKALDATAEAIDERTEVKIMATKAMRCFVQRCAIPIGNQEPFILVSSGGGAIFAHMRCLGMNVSGNYGDPAYLQHIKQRLQSGLRDN